jgi:malate dehydrogenase (quinone)
VCENPEVVNHHLAKVYGQASVGAPPMSVPHIDTRIIDGKRVVLFGPFATFSVPVVRCGICWRHHHLERQADAQRGSG